MSQDGMTPFYIARIEPNKQFVLVTNSLIASPGNIRFTLLNELPQSAWQPIDNDDSPYSHINRNKKIYKNLNTNGMIINSVPGLLDEEIHIDIDTIEHLRMPNNLTHAIFNSHYRSQLYVNN